MNFNYSFKIATWSLKRKWKSNLKVFFVFTISFILLVAFSLYISLLDGAMKDVLNAQKENRTIFVDTNDIYQTLDLDVADINNPHIAEKQAIYASFPSGFDSGYAYVGSLRLYGSDMRFSVNLQENYDAKGYDGKREIGTGEFIASSALLQNWGFEHPKEKIGITFSLKANDGTFIFKDFTLIGVSDDDEGNIVVNTALREDFGHFFFIRRYILLTVDDFTNIQTVMDYLDSSFQNLALSRGNLDSEEYLEEINNHRVLMNNVFLILSLIILLAVFFCLLLIVLSEQKRAVKMMATHIAVGAKAVNLFLIELIKYTIIILFSLTCALILNSGIYFILTNLLSKILSIESFSLSASFAWRMFLMVLIVEITTIFASLIVLKKSKKNYAEMIKEL